jgi:hypothetical protein
MQGNETPRNACCRRSLPPRKGESNAGLPVCRFFFGSVRKEAHLGVARPQPDAGPGRIGGGQDGPLGVKQRGEEGSWFDRQGRSPSSGQRSGTAAVTTRAASTRDAMDINFSRHRCRKLLPSVGVIGWGSGMEALR